MTKVITLATLLLATLSFTIATPVETGLRLPYTLDLLPTPTSSESITAAAEPTVLLKQATRDEIIARANRPEHARRAAPSPAPAPERVVANPQDPNEEFPIPTYYYDRYYTGSGFNLNEDNPGLGEGWEMPARYRLSSEYTQNQAIEECAILTWNSVNRFYSFTLYYDATPGGENEDLWVCRAYPERNKDTSYFNDPNPYAGPVFGYSF
ncbi:hypothetical protein IAT40_005659 [Kwoniella sp. CBS 6097]